MNVKFGFKQAIAPFILTASVLLLFLFFSKSCYSYKASPNDKVIEVVYSFFASVKAGNYPKTWSCLTQASKKGIVQSIENSFKKNKINGVSAGEIRNDMKSGGGIAGAYWGGYLKSFNPEIALKYSKWKVRFIHSDSAEIQINYIYSKQTAFLKAFKENNRWKFGLTESFWTRKALNNVVNTAGKIF